MKNFIDKIIEDSTLNSSEFDLTKVDRKHQPGCNCKECREEMNHETLLDLEIASSIEEDREIVGSTDDRKRIGRVRKKPFRWICHLELNFPDPDRPWRTKPHIGSGVLISNQHILTVGHNLKNRVKGSRGTIKVQNVSSVRAFPAASGNFSLGSSYMSDFTIHPNWRSSLDPRFDIALIKLKRKVGARYFSILGEKLGYWGKDAKARIMPFDKDLIINRTANLAGYPGDKDLYRHKHMYWDAAKIINVNPQIGPELFYYKMDTCPGHSGSPVWLKHVRSGRVYMIGIHRGLCNLSYGGSKFTDCISIGAEPSCFGRKRSANAGVFLSKSLINLVRSWMRTM